MERFYKTGDLARWLTDGNIEFLGRMDFQVKIRGFRIELGEIEAQLLSHKDITEAVVLATNQLYAYIVSATGFDPGVLRQYLGRRLPSYMVPSFFIRVEEIPLTATGKIDRRKLAGCASIEGGVPGGDVVRAAPETHLQKMIAREWQEVLKRDVIGIDDNVFDLGGTSFDIIRINQKLAAQLNRDFPVVKMFTYPTVRSLADYLAHGQAEPAPTGNIEEQTMEKMDRRKDRLKERGRRKKLQKI